MKPFQCECCRRFIDAEQEPQSGLNVMRINRVNPENAEPTHAWVMICSECLKALDQTGAAPIR